MSTRTPEEDLAGIARDLRRALELERAGGTGDLLARAAKASLARPPKARPAAAATRSEAVAFVQSSSFAAAAREVRTQASRAPVASGILMERAAPGAPVPSVFDLELPPVHPALNAADPFEREKIGFESLRVLEDVAREVRMCRLCGLCDTRTKAVPGTGSARSGIVFVGEAPGAEEDRTGEPFVGRAGELLTKIIKAMDDAKLIPGIPLNRETVYICNVLKCRPPENRNPLPHEVDLCSPYLRRQLEALQPRVICCLGKFAAELLVGVKGTIASMRGSIYRYQGAKLIVTYHPAACLRNPNYKRPVWEDMQLLAREYSAA